MPSSDEPALYLWVSEATRNLPAATAHFLETCLCMCVCMCVLEHLMQKEWRERLQMKGINRKLEVSVVCWSSQKLTDKSFSCGVHPGFLRWRASSYAHTDTHAITDVTRIQEGVAAYYILTAHSGCLAWLGLFKRLRLDKQRGFCLCSLLISSLSLCISAISQCCSVSSPKLQSPHTSHAHRNTHRRPKAQFRLQPWQDSKFDTIVLLGC